MFKTAFKHVQSEAIPKWLQLYLGRPDARVQRLPLLSSPIYLIAVYVVYFTVLLIGTKLMKTRKPFTLRKSLIFYNCFQILFSAYVCKEIFLTAFLSGYNPFCAKIDYSKNQLHTRVNVEMVNAFWWLYLSKIIDLLDTAIFVLRKKRSQLTFLHLYHHTSMIFNWYLGVLYLPGGQAYLSAGLNSFVHLIMYTYYLLAAMGPGMQKYLWWKKYLTQIQLVQFFIVMIHIIIGGYSGCNNPQWLAWFSILYLVTLVLLFMNFYVQAYKTKKQPKEKEFERMNIDYRAAGDGKID